MNLSDSSCVFSKRIYFIYFSLSIRVQISWTGVHFSFKLLVSFHDQHVCVFLLNQEVLRNRTACPSITSPPEEADPLACGAFKGLCPGGAFRVPQFEFSPSQTQLGVLLQSVDLVMARHSKLQKQVLALYRQFLQAGKDKPGFVPRIREEFRVNARIKRTDVMHIEYLYRRGQRQLEQLKDINTKQLGSFSKPDNHS